MTYENQDMKNFAEAARRNNPEIILDILEERPLALDYVPKMDVLAAYGLLLGVGDGADSERLYVVAQFSDRADKGELMDLLDVARGQYEERIKTRDNRPLVRDSEF